MFPDDDGKEKAGEGGGEEGVETYEESDAVVIDFSGDKGDEGGDDEGEEGDGEGKEGGDKGGEGDKGKKEEAKPHQPPPSLSEIVEQVTKELGKKEKKEAEKADGYTYDQLDAAEMELAGLLQKHINNEDGGIDLAQYQTYMGRIRREREKLNEETLIGRIEGTRKRGQAEEGVVLWAKENLPELTDGRSKEYKDAVAWAKETLAVEEKGDHWVIPKKIGPIAFGILHKGQQGGSEEGDGKKGGEGNKGKGKTYEDGMREESARGAELRGRENRIPKGGKPRDKGDESGPITDKERAIFDKIGFDPKKAGLYRKLRKMGGGKSVVEVK